MSDWIIFLLTLFLIFYVAYAAGVKKDISLLHGYHRKNVRKEDIPAMANKVAISMLALGIGIIVVFLCERINYKIGMIVGVIIVLAAVAYQIFAIIRYNGSLFGFCKPK